MNRLFQVFAYAILVIIGALMIGVSSDGHIIVTCIACNAGIFTFFGVVSIVTGGAGLIGAITENKKSLSNR